MVKIWMLLSQNLRIFSEAEQFDPLFVVGVDPVNHVIVDAPEYDEASAQELVQSLTEKGVAGVRIFDNPKTLVNMLSIS